MRTAELPVPAELQFLASGGEMQVRVFMNAEGAPRHAAAVDEGGGPVLLEFTAPAGEHSFTVVFDYRDPEFVRPDGAPWEIARWTSDPIRVADGEDVLLEISEYVYADSDGDGLSNLEEIIARTNPGDANQPGGGGPVEEPVSIVASVEGIWRGETSDGDGVFAILHDGRLLMTAGSLIFAGSYEAEGDAITGEVDVYGAGGERITRPGAIPLTVVSHDDSLGLTIGEEGATFSLDPDDSTGAGASLDRIARTWTASLERPDGMLVFPVDTNGVITGAIDSRGCLYGGVFEMLDAGVNVYGIALAISDQVPRGCGSLEGDGYEGYASLVQDDEGLRLIVVNGDQGLALALGRAGDAPSADDEGIIVWAVAADGTIHRRAGTQWDGVARAGAGLHAIHCPSSASCWAVGEEGDGRATIVHWDGAGWSEEGFVNDTPDEDLYDVTCTAADRCWAVGENDGRRANIVLWNGAAWTRAGFINDAPGADLYAVSCAGPDDCWAVGEARRGRGFVVRWDGDRWSSSRSGPPGVRDLNGVACAASDDCVAVGDARRGVAEAVVWDGNDWNAVDGGVLPPADLESVACAAQDVCWAVGRADGDRAAIARRDASGWSTAGFINGAPGSDLRGIHCAARSCWAVGDDGVALHLEAGHVWSPHVTGGGAPLRDVFIVTE